MKPPESKVCSPRSFILILYANYSKKSTKITGDSIPLGGYCKNLSQSYPHKLPTKNSQARKADFCINNNS
jgi:hypothetical protein